MYYQDAQIALYMFGEYTQDGKNYAFTSFLSKEFINWALDGTPLPDCSGADGHRFIPNHDIQHHVNKGL